MSLKRFFIEEFVEVIEWREQDRNTMLWKFPDRDCNIKYGANLTVRESQMAMFLNEGEFADEFEPGRFELLTENMPLLTSLKNWDKGFKSPFLCDVYFASTKTFTDLKWGTVNPIILRDPEFKQVRVKAHGTYFLKIKDPKLFFTNYAGTKGQVKVGEIEASLRDIISPNFAEALAELEVSVLDMVKSYTELGYKVLPILQVELDKFGLELEKFQVSSISLPKEVEEFYDKMTNMNMVDNMNKFQQFQTAQAMEKAAENPGGGGSEGIGMGMGFGMAQQMMNQQNQQQAQPQKETPNNTSANSGKAQTREEIMDTLKSLGELKASGVLTEEEFDTKKKELLSRL